jgi:sugar/nucleoside kinase (ribokinase family)
MKTVLLGMGTFAMDTLIGCRSLPQEDSFSLVNKEKVMPGGSCANMLVTFAALGGTSRMIAKIGDDETGILFRQSLKDDGVDDSLLQVKPGGISLHTYVFTTPDGTHSILVNPGDSMMELKAEELGPELLQGVDIFYSDLFPPAATVSMAKMCKKKGIPVILCLECAPSFMHTLGVNDVEIADAVLLADLFIGGREGLYELTGCTDYREGAAELYERYRPACGVICTAGSEGALWLDDNDVLTAPALPVVAVDSTGAGDSFLGALLYSYYQLREPRLKALQFATAAGALKCTVSGSRLKTTEAGLRGFIAGRR